MRIFMPGNICLSSRDVRLVSSIVRVYHALPGNSTVSPKALSRCRPPATPWSRGAKTKATKKLKELHQGPIAVDRLPDLEADDAPQYPTVIQGAKHNMMRFKNCVLITRVGNFYEVRLPLPLSVKHSLTFTSSISIMPKSTRLS